MKLEKILSLILALSQVMSKVVLPEIVIYARKTIRGYLVRHIPGTCRPYLQGLRSVQGQNIVYAPL